jgi:hypothetical protein
LLEPLDRARAKSASLGSVEDALAAGEKLLGLLDRVSTGARSAKVCAHDARLGCELAVAGDLRLDGVEPRLDTLRIMERRTPRRRQ